MELDGSQHYEPDKQKKDRERTEYLQSQGVQVLRFSNLEVLQQFRAVCEVIDREVQKKLLPGNTLPRGEGVSEADG